MILSLQLIEFSWTGSVEAQCSNIFLYASIAILCETGSGCGMYIRRTTIESRRTGEPYYTYRLVESIRASLFQRPVKHRDS